MTYKSISELPASVRVLEKVAQHVFLAAANTRLALGVNQDVALMQAWGVVRKRSPSAQTLYVRRDVMNADEIIKWAKEQGFTTTYPPESMHVTIAYSKAKVAWPKPAMKQLTVSGGKRKMDMLGSEEKPAWVLRFDDDGLEKRWQDLCDQGCSWEHDGYKPHVTISLDAKDVDLSKVKPYMGDIVLGPEVFEPVATGDWRDNVTEKAFAKVAVTKVDKKLGLVFGWAIVCKERALNGEFEAYFDTQDDHIPEDTMLRVAAKFMSESREMKDMHKGDRQGDIVFGFPLTEDVAKAMGISCDKTGLMVAAKPTPEIFAKFESGEYTGFSIGGRRIIDQVLAEELA